MAPVSNFTGSNPIDPTDADGVECRIVQRGEIESAIRLILATPAGLGADAQVLDFVSFCVERKIDTSGTWIAIHRGRIVWSMLPVLSPGNTMLLFTPQVLFSQTPQLAISRICDELCAHHSMRGIQLAQMLIDPEHRPIIDAYRHAGFDELAELVYLQRIVKSRRFPAPEVPANLTFATYSSTTHTHFAEVIQRSYENSQDCPGLNGLRTIDDVILGHQATGDFDPALWFVLYDQASPIAVLLLARLPQSQTIELVYLGLAPTARGKGFGNLLMHHALAIASNEGRNDLTLAVDSRNKPALQLYFRHGLRRIGARAAMLRDLRKASGRSGILAPSKA
jgi:ribosomal protein S18 acetylase RimI-like enzyme